jgi:hypothetical protein
MIYTTLHRTLNIEQLVYVAQSLVFCVVLCRSLFVFSVVYVAQCLVFCVVLCRSLFVFSVVCVAQQWSTEQNTKYWATQTTLKINNDLHNTTHWFVFSVVCVAQCLVFCVVLCRSLFVFSVVCVAQYLVFCSVDHCLFSV